VGGHNYKYFKYDHVNHTAKRQVGSTFKPFVYTAAIDNGFSPCTMVPNKPVSFEGYPDYNPSNADEKYSTPTMTMYRGLKLSFNLVCLNVLKLLGDDGIKTVIDYAQRMGIKSKVEPYPASALGTADISLYEMVGAYATFANKGIWTKPIYLTRIVDKNGNIIFENLPVTKEALSEQTAYVMCKMLEQTTTSGTAAKIKYEYKIPGACGGKTGTTQNYSDAWFMGITPTLVSGLWVGWEDRAIHFRTMNLGSGGSLAMPFWAEYMKRVTAKPGLINIVDQWPAPQNPLTLEINCEKFEEEAPEKLDFMEGE
jgi:penicillin-binding protein 1A